MEDFDILNKFDNDKLIDVVKNYKRYGYDDELRDYAINLLGERGWNREDLQQFGYLTNHDYDEAEKQYKAYKRNSLIGICTLIFSGGILAVVYLIFLIMACSLPPPPTTRTFTLHLANSLVKCSMME